MGGGLEKALNTGMDLSASESVIAVTGGTSGIGKATSLRLLAAGARVAACYSRSSAEATALRDNWAGDPAALLVSKVDISHEEAVSSWATEVVNRFGRVTGLVNNAGVFEPGDLLATTVPKWDRVIDTNLKGPFLCARAFAPSILASGGPGRIINVGSWLGPRQLPGRGAYSAAKAGLLALTETWALELAPNITVNAVLPGTIDTRINQDWLAVPELRAALEEPIPLGRIGLADEVAVVIHFLLSRLAGYITGARIAVDGGMGVSPNQRPGDAMEVTLARHE